MVQLGGINLLILSSESSDLGSARVILSLESYEWNDRDN